MPWQCAVLAHVALTVEGLRCLIGDEKLGVEDLALAEVEASAYLE